MIGTERQLQECGCTFATELEAGWRKMAFTLPHSLEASEPPEARGIRRDQVKMLASNYAANRFVHTEFAALPRFLDAGDLIVINTSGTMKAALKARRADGSALEIHLSTRLPADLWSVELRRPNDSGTEPFYQAVAGETLEVEGGGSIKLHTPHAGEQRNRLPSSVRLWIASLRLPLPALEYLERYGFPIRYSYVKDSWPAEYYQTVYAEEVGSAEMPSAGRAFTSDLISELAAKGVQFAPLVLHTGVASLEDHEPPYEEYFRVPASTARQVNAVRAAGARVIGVGTTVIRALETVTDETGVVHPGKGWTNLVIRANQEIRSVDGMITGFHEPRATHLAMLEALAGFHHICMAYEAALRQGYLWHEFGDMHLILP